VGGVILSYMVARKTSWGNYTAQVAP